MYCRFLGASFFKVILRRSSTAYYFLILWLIKRYNVVSWRDKLTIVLIKACAGFFVVHQVIQILFDLLIQEAVLTPVSTVAHWLLQRFLTLRFDSKKVKASLDIESTLGRRRRRRRRRRKLTGAVWRWDIAIWISWALWDDCQVLELQRF